MLFNITVKVYSNFDLHLVPAALTRRILGSAFAQTVERRKSKSRCMRIHTFFIARDCRFASRSKPAKATLRYLSCWPSGEIAVQKDLTLQGNQAIFGQNILQPSLMSIKCWISANYRPESVHSWLPNALLRKSRFRDAVSRYAVFIHSMLRNT